MSRGLAGWPVPTAAAIALGRGPGMVRALYAAGAGMLVQQARVDLIANDLANAQTAGYFRDDPLIRSLPELPLVRVRDQVVGLPPGAPAPVGRAAPAAPVGPLGTGAAIERVVTRFVEGPLRPTGNPLDVAIRGRGFFAVETPAGPRYTRAGRFTLSPDGWLVTVDGLRVLGAGPDGTPAGPIRVQGREVSIDGRGFVVVDGQVAGRLAVVDFANLQGLEKEGGTLFRATPEAGPPVAAQAELSPGYLEMANVNPVTALVSLIEAQRAYEAGQRAIQVADQTLGLAVNDVGRLRA